MTTVKEICGVTIVDYKGAEHTCQRKKGHERFHLDNRDGHLEQWNEKDAAKLAAYHEKK